MDHLELIKNGDFKLKKVDMTPRPQVLQQPQNHLDLIKNGDFKLKKVDKTQPKPPPKKEKDPNALTLQDALQQAASTREAVAVVSDSNESESGNDSPSSWDPPAETTPTPEDIKAEEAEKAKQVEQKKQQDLQRLLDDAKKELKELPRQQERMHVGEFSDDTINGFVLPEEKDRKKSISAATIQSSQEKLDEIRDTMKAKVPVLKKERQVLYELQNKAAEAKVALMQTKLDNSGDLQEKQIAYENLSKQVQEQDHTVVQLQQEMQNKYYAAKKIIDETKTSDNTWADIAKGLAKIREQVRNDNDSD
jgi:tRNA/tmRNA/rRNA uracil-C5-methylase (TrmA/RlmC/RlmD family)